MKSLKIERFGLIIFFSLVVVISAVESLGVTSPMPPNLRMMPGDTAEFAFSIQAVTSTDKQSCSCYTEGFDPLIITFKDNTITINPGQAGVVYGVINAPYDAPIKGYTGKIFASCSPIIETQDLSGSRINQISGTKYTISVVGSESDRNVPEMPKPTKKETQISTSAVITIIIIIAAIAIGVYYWFERSKKK